MDFWFFNIIFTSVGEIWKTLWWNYIFVTVILIIQVIFYVVNKWYWTDNNNHNACRKHSFPLNYKITPKDCVFHGTQTLGDTTGYTYSLRSALSLVPFSSLSLLISGVFIKFTLLHKDKAGNASKWKFWIGKIGRKIHFYRTVKWLQILSLYS